MCHDPRTGVGRGRTRARLGVQVKGRGVKQHGFCGSWVGYTMLARGERGNGALSHEGILGLTAVCHSELHLSKTGGLCWWALVWCSGASVCGLQHRRNVRENNKQATAIASLSGCFCN